jgi:hypothetical protein
VTKLHDSRGKWPFPLVTELRHRGSRDWVEIDEERRDHFMGALPPIPFVGGFFVSEPADHVVIAGREVPVYAAVVHRGDRYFMREVPHTEVELRCALNDLDMALSAGRRSEALMGAVRSILGVDERPELLDCPIHGTATGATKDEGCPRC